MLSKEDKKFLELYSDSEYEKPSVTVDAVIFRLISNEVDNYRKLPEKKLQVLLLKRKFSPYKNKFALPGTFIDLNFELSRSAKLCVEKKVGIKNFYMEQLFTFGEKNRDPRSRVISTSYMLLTNIDEQNSDGVWFDVDLSFDEISEKKDEKGVNFSSNAKLSLKHENIVLNSEISINIERTGREEQKTVKILQTDLAFDHCKIILYALERLKNKIEYTDIIFNLLPEKFTLTELKMCYEIILGKKLLDANFRRKTTKLVEPLSEYEDGAGHRKSQLFRRKMNFDLSNLD